MAAYELPKAPDSLTGPVKVWSQPVVIPTYLPALPDKNPMFLERRVYQGSSGRVYPLPFTDRISEQKADRAWQAVHLENEHLRIMILPEIGGRIHAILDKSNGYDLIYNQPVIKPALVGLAGPWISGGIEFNWPQHHRPATFLPVDFEIEQHDDGSSTVWCGDHDPMCRMKGMHGVCLHPGRAIVELKARAYNRTQFVQTFLWWANVATRVHEAYQSFFPPDVYYVADHARRSMSEYPLAKGFYYGVNYGRRAKGGIPAGEVPSQFVPSHCRREDRQENQEPHSLNYAPNDLSFYANIPTPCSYMCMGSRGDFFGGYDYTAHGGIVHIANHHISPGKKQWTWGNHDFGYAWDRNLTEKDSRGVFDPYIEIMAGVYTDNQPDFSFLQPGETKTWSQFWYPIQKIGPAQQANRRAAVSLGMAQNVRSSGAVISLGVCVTETFNAAHVSLTTTGKKLLDETHDLTPGAPFLREVNLPHGVRETDVSLRITESSGREIISYQPSPLAKGQVPPPASEPAAPAEITSADELYLTGLHLEQYRHATRCPTIYWREALRRDPLDSRCNNAMGLWYLRRGEFAEAETHFRRAIQRLTRRNANPYDGEAYYNLGVCLRHQLDSQPAGSSSKFDEAYAAFYKATWNQAWTSAAFHALAELDCRRGDWDSALDHLNRSLRLNTENLQARNLKVMVLWQLNRADEADALLSETLSLDPLDWWSRNLRWDETACDSQAKLDIAHDLARAGFHANAVRLLESAAATQRDLPDQNWGAAPLVHYTLGWLHDQTGDAKSALAEYTKAAALPHDYCFPARLEEIAILESAMRANRGDSRAPYYLGNLLYDRRRHEEALRLWQRSAKLDPKFSVVWRNLGIGYFNVRKDSAKARRAYQTACRTNPNDARLLYEYDQLRKRLGENPAKRLNDLERRLDLVSGRDDLSIEICALYNQTGRHADALALVSSRNFQPWEGGEGGPLGQHVRTHLMIGRAALAQHDFAAAAEHFENALSSPVNLGEAKHLLANQSDIHFWLGVARDLLGDKKAARDHWRAAADFRGDFQEGGVRLFSEMTYYSALSQQRLGRTTAAKKVLHQLLTYARNLADSQAKTEYFATSLPTMLLFDDDLQYRQKTTALFLQAQARLGLGDSAKAKSLLSAVLRRDPNHALAADLSAQVFQTGKP